MGTGGSSPFPCSFLTPEVPVESLTNFSHQSPPRPLSGGLQTTLDEQPACGRKLGPFRMPGPSPPSPPLERGFLESSSLALGGWGRVGSGVGEAHFSPAPNRYNYKIKFYNLCYGSKSPWLAVSSRCQAPWHSGGGLKFQTRKKDPLYGSDFYHEQDLFGSKRRKTT